MKDRAPSCVVRTTATHSEKGNVSAWVGFGRRVRLGVGRGWWVIPDVIVFPIIVGRKHEWVGRSITGDGIREWLDDRRQSTLIGVAQSACPAEHAVLGLVQCPAALALQSMVMTTGVTEVGPGGGSALGVVKGVVLVGFGRERGSRSWCRTGPGFPGSGAARHRGRGGRRRRSTNPHWS